MALGSPEHRRLPGLRRLLDRRHADPTAVETMSLDGARAAFGLMAQVNPQTVTSERAFAGAYSQLLAAMGRHLILFGDEIGPEEYGSVSVWDTPDRNKSVHLRLDYTAAAEDLGRTARGVISTFDPSGMVVDSFSAPDEPDKEAFRAAMLARLTPSRILVTEYLGENYEKLDLLDYTPKLDLDYTFAPRMDYPHLLIRQLREPKYSRHVLATLVGAKSDDPRKWTYQQRDIAINTMTRTVELPASSDFKLYPADYTFAAGGVQQAARLLLDRDQIVRERSGLPPTSTA